VTPRTTVHPATVRFEERDVAELRRRIRATRAVDVPFDDRWAYGTGKDVVRELAELWLDFDVAALSRDLNAVPQVDVTLDGLRVRVFHVRSERDDALPIVLTHGWPSSILEPLELADRLARPSAYGADPDDSFHVVVPALPGFPLSAAPSTLDGYTAARIADRWVQVMTALGYPRFAAHAGDIGARVTAWLGARHPDHVVGIHVSSNALATPPADADLSAAERSWLRQRALWSQAEGAYMQIQQTKPLSLAHGMADSPAGLAAWISEKWHGWSDRRSGAIDRFSPTHLLGHLTLYWLTNSIATSLIHYHVHDRTPGPRPPAGSVDVPVSFFLSPAENGGIPPRELAERQFTVTRWSELPRGGHFLASEEPELLVADIRAAFRPARNPRPRTSRPV
jgi:pimeloyl-ACP methyl ester carboxylesterase